MSYLFIARRGLLAGGALLLTTLGAPLDALAVPPPLVESYRDNVARPGLAQDTESQLAECSWELALRRVFLNLFTEYTGRPAARSGAGKQRIEFYSARGRPRRLTITIVDDARPNAFAMKGRTAELRLTAGLLAMLRSEDEIGFVLAHEMAHLQLDHFAPELPDALFTAEQLSRIGQVHRSWEAAADRRALLHMEKAGLDPDAGASLLERLSAFEPNAAADLGRRHPGTADRIIMMRSRQGQAALQADASLGLTN